MKGNKNVTNLEIAELLRAVAASYQLKDEKKNRFKIIAYQRVADAVEHATSELKDLWDDGKLEELPGIGPSIAKHLDSLFRTGKSEHFDSVMEGLPPSMFEFMKVPGIGAKTGYRLAKELKLKNLKELKEAARKGKIATLPGFGEESERDIIKGIEESKGKVRRLLLPYATEVAQGILNWLSVNTLVKKVEPLGSLRRKAATVGDIDIAVATDKPKEVLKYFTEYPDAQRVIELGEATAGIVAAGGIHIDLMVQPPSSFGSLLQHFTGSKHHNIALREYAQKKGLSLSEYGIKKDQKRYRFATEEEFYGFLGLEWIPPELREDQGEIEAALNSKLPKLLELSDVKGDFQIHSNFDIETSHDVGASSMEEIVKKAGELNYEYLAFTEHNPSKSGHSEGEIVDILKRKAEAIEKLNYSILRTVKNSIKKVFNSLEIDILPDGRLPVSEKGLKTLDFALVSIHSSFRLPKEEMTKRVLSALAYPSVKIFAHPTGRKLNEREGAELDWPKIFEFCLKNDKWLEINADPMRLDLPDVLVHEAVKSGVKLTLGTDAHHASALTNMRYGVSVARRGWAESNDIVNTRSLQEFLKML
ncbi:hypothetical protein HY502_00625 [Candidatus Woesebacteria bacterium]|nr:hypothetical protein [Candidatus Woesebacteria bacterium]